MRTMRASWSAAGDSALDSRCYCSLRLGFLRAYVLRIWIDLSLEFLLCVSEVDSNLMRTKMECRTYFGSPHRSLLCTYFWRESDDTSCLSRQFVFRRLYNYQVSDNPSPMMLVILFFSPLVTLPCVAHATPVYANASVIPSIHDMVPLSEDSSHPEFPRFLGSASWSSDLLDLNNYSPPAACPAWCAFAREVTDYYTKVDTIDRSALDSIHNSNQSRCDVGISHLPDVGTNPAPAVVFGFRIRQMMGSIMPACEHLLSLCISGSQLK